MASSSPPGILLADTPERIPVRSTKFEVRSRSQDVRGDYSALSDDRFLEPVTDGISVSCTESTRATKTAGAVQNGADAPTKEQVRQLAAEHDDMERAVQMSVIYIYDRVCDVLLKDPGNVHAIALQDKWQQHAFKPLRKTVPSGSMSHTFYECMQTVAKARQWVLTGVVTPIVID